MGQVLGSIQDKFNGKKWKERQIRIIADKVFDTIKSDSRDAHHLTLEELYIAVLCIYNEINKRLPVPHCDPPTKDNLKATIQEFDMNLDGLLDRNEFAEFIKKITADTLTVVSRKLIISLIVAPTVALMSKKATEGVPGVGKTVQRIPNSVYASLVTLAVVWVQNSALEL